MLAPQPSNFNQGFAIAIILLGFILFLVAGIELIFFITINRFKIFKKNKIVDFTFVIYLFIVFMSVIVGGVISYLWSKEPKYKPYVIAWWVLSVLILISFIIRVVSIFFTNKTKYKITEFKTMDFNKIENEFNLVTFQLKANKQSKWYKTLCDKEEQLKTQILSITSFGRVGIYNVLLEELIIFQESSIIYFSKNKRKHALVIFVRLAKLLNKIEK